MSDGEDDNIRGDIEAALRELEVDDAPAKETKSQEPEADGPARDERGRFAAKNADQNQAQPEEGTTEPPKATTRPMPASLKPELKARWEQLDPDAQEEFLRLEAETQKAKREWGEKASRFNKLDEVLGSSRQMWELQGLTEDQAIKQLLAAENLLRTDPVRGLQWLAQQYGVHPSQVGAVMQAQQQMQPQGSAYGNELQALVDQITELRSWKEQTEQARTQAEEAEANRIISEFASKPENRFFHDVRDQMAAIMDAGLASTLEDAYDLACYRNPQIRQLREAQRAETQKAQQAAASAKRAAGSVTGSPGRGADAPAKPVSHASSIRADIEAAIASLSS